MQANGLWYSEEIRMRSPVVWLCFAAVILCALSTESEARNSYNLIEAQAGPIYRSIIPTTGYRKISAKILGRDVQEEEYNEDDEEEEEDDDEEANEADYEYSSNYPYDDEVEEEEDEQEVEEENEEALYDDIEGRQAYVNNNYVEDSYLLRQNVQRPQPNPNRPPVRNPNQNRPNPVNWPNAPNRPRPNGNRRPAPNAVRPGNRQQPPRGNRPAPQRNQANNQKLSLRPVASTTQFVATPVADLILRLSISIAKPIPGANGNRNGPVRPPPRAPVRAPVRPPPRAPVRAPVRAPARAPVRQHDDALVEESQSLDSVPMTVTVEKHRNDVEVEHKDQTPEVVTEQSKN